MLLSNFSFLCYGSTLLNPYAYPFPIDLGVGNFLLDLHLEQYKWED